MPDRLRTGDKLVGSKQTRRAIKEGRAKTVYIASDADSFIVRPIEELAGENGIEIVCVQSMKELGELCGVEVSTACAALV